MVSRAVLGEVGGSLGGVGCEHTWQLDRLTVHDGKVGGEYTCATCGLFEWVPDGIEETVVYWPED